MRLSPLIVCAALLLGGCAGPEEPPATLAFVDLRVWTGDASRPWAEAVAVRDGRIVAVGSTADVQPLIGPDTERVSVEGALLLPGFIDSHTHLLDGGVTLASVQLRDARSPEQFVQRFADHVAERPDGEWVLGGTWDHEAWGGELPTRQWIDAVTPEHPVWVYRLDGHMALANSLALELAGIDAATSDVEGGEIVRDGNGQPTGVFKDNAMALVERVVPAFSESQRDEQLRAALDYLAANGVTTAHDMATFESLATLRRARARDALAVRVHAYVPLAEWQRLEADVAAHGRGDDWLRSGGLKGFMDGSLGSHTAAFLEPYSDTPTDRGFLINELADMGRWISAADAAGLHIAVHAIGDRAIRDLLDIYARTAEQNGPRDRRFRIEHAQHIHPDDLGRFAAQQIIASMQPYHCIDDGRWAERVIGTERSRTTYAFRALMDSGATVAFGSDWFVAPASPLEGIYAAVTRRTLDGAHPEGWVPEEKIPVEDALRAYTANAAYATFDEDRKGRIAPGMLADLVLLDRDITAVAPEAIRQVRVLQTVVGGRTSYRP